MSCSLLTTIRVVAHALFQLLPDSPVLSPDDLIYVRDSLGFNSFCQPYIDAPPPASLRYLKLDILMDLYGLQIQNHVLNPNLKGSFALIHQLFQSVLGCGQFNMFIEHGETYPLQTWVCNLQELDLHIGTQYYGDVSYLWPEMAQSLTVLTIQLRALFLLPPSVCMSDHDAVPSPIFS